MKQLQILETNEAFTLTNHEEFENVFKNPYISLAKIETVEEVGKVKFTLKDFIKLIDLSWNTEGRSDHVELMKVGKALDYRQAFTSVLTWESRRINSKGDGRKGLWTLLIMNFMKKKIWEIIKNES